MTVGELFSVQRDTNKIRSLCIELERHNDFNPYKGNVLTDMPRCGNRKNFLEWHTEEGERIQKDIDYYQKKLQEDRKKVEDYIHASPYPECDIIRYRAINNLSWEEIGGLVGYSGRQSARRFWNYIKDVQNVQDVGAKV